MLFYNTCNTQAKLWVLMMPFSRMNFFFFLNSVRWAGKEDELDKACSTHGGGGEYVQNFSHLGDLGIYGMVILKWILNKYVMRAWINGVTGVVVCILNWYFNVKSTLVIVHLIFCVCLDTYKATYTIGPSYLKELRHEINKTCWVFVGTIIV
jgi:hypothetical protein